jgi:TatD DNase family protein
LDYYYFTENDDVAAIKAKQRAVFDEQIKLALEMDKVLMIHCRPTKGSMDAYQDIVEIISKVKSQNSNLRFQVHCYTGNAELAEKFVELGGYISLTGIITFDKSGVSREVVERVPLDHILIETDAPYLTPAPFRGERNEPRYVKYVAEKIAEIKGVSVEEVSKVTTKNTRTLFKI